MPLICNTQYAVQMSANQDFSDMLILHIMVYLCWYRFLAYRTIWWSMSYELESMAQKVVIMYFEIVPECMSGGADKYHEKPVRTSSFGPTIYVLNR